MEASEDKSYNNETSEDKSNMCPYSNREHVDCKDTEDKWINGEIVGINNGKVHIHYSGFSDKWNEWIEWDSNRILKQWSNGREFQINNRIDAKDTYNKWLEAFIIKLNGDGTIKIHFKGFTARWDQDMKKDDECIAQIGYHSAAFGAGRKARPGRLATEKQNGEDSDEKKEKVKKRLEKEEEFKRKLAEISYKIYSCGGDGNCLFRAISHQVYGTEDHFKYIRRRCMDYLEHEKDYFKSFLPEGYPTVESYVEERRK
mmetsp:Transcript_31275/g.27645  ORF Transcript_31275/g.27645 Transcript_31275/m.27645 type:complete len:257 (-) Transcript_31275:220-990(-)